VENEADPYFDEEVSCKSILFGVVPFFLRVGGEIRAKPWFE